MQYIVIFIQRNETEFFNTFILKIRADKIKSILKKKNY